MKKGVSPPKSAPQGLDMESLRKLYFKELLFFLTVFQMSRTAFSSQTDHNVGRKKNLTSEAPPPCCFSLLK